MSLLTDWIQIETKEKIRDIDEQFRNGYLFGKLLDSLGFEDISSYVYGNTTDALIKNYTTLENTLREKLKIKLSSNTCLDLIHGKKGSAIKLLYEIKRSADLIPPKVKVLKKATPKFDSYPSSPVDGETTNPIALVEQLPYEKQAVEHFATILKSKLRRSNFKVAESPKELPPLTKKAELPNQGSIKKERPLPKIAKMKPEDGFGLKDIPMAAEVTKAAPGKDSPSKLEEKPLYQKGLKYKKIMEDIDKFEKNVKETDLNPTVVEDYVKHRAKMDPSVHLQELNRIAEPSLQAQKQTEQYLTKIRANRLEIEVSRKEHEKRRKKSLLIHQQLQKELEAKSLDQIVEAKLLRQSKQERRIAEQLLQVRHEKEVMREHRMYREEQYAKQRQKEYEQALERERQLCQTIKQEFQEKVQMQLQQHYEILEQKKIAKHEKNVRFCQHLVGQILDLSFQTIDYKKLNDGKEVPPKKFREWKLLFQNDLAMKEPEFPAEKEFIPPSSDEPVIEEDRVKEEIPIEIQTLDTLELHDYINFENTWAVDKSGLSKNAELANLIEDLFQITLPPIQPYPITPIPAVPLRIAITGKKCAGKSTLAKYLADKYQMTILKVDDLVKDAISHADISVKKSKEKAITEKDKKLLSKHQIGAKLQAALIEGQAPDDQLLVALILEAMSQEPEHPGGYLLVDFPKTRQQAQLLEREISGYEDPKPIKKGDLKRPKDKDRANTGNTRNRSLISPVDNPVDNPVLQPISGLDAVFLLDVKNETAFKRAAGQLFDPVTNSRYHVENNPPPSDNPGVYDRLTAIEDPGRVMSQLQYHLTAFAEEEEGLKDWLSQFKTLHVIDANSSREATQKQVIEQFNEIVNQINKVRQRDLEEMAEAKEQQDTLEVDQIQISERTSRIGDRMSIVKQPHEPNELPAITEPIIEESKSKKPTIEMAKILIDQWKIIETTYTDQLKYAFRSHRRTARDILHYFYETKSRFADFLKRPDNEQNLIELFQTEYNAIEEDFRADPEVKAELHQRAEELRDKLWEIADRRRDEAETERLAIIEDKWVEDQSYVIANTIVTILQAEADRYFATRQLILDYYKDSEGILSIDIPKNQLKIPFIQNGTQAPIEVAVPLISLSEQQTTHRKDQVHSASQQKPAAATKEKGKEKKEKQKQSEQKNTAPAPPTEKDFSQYLDPESNYFPDIQGAIDCFLNAVQSPEYSLEPILAIERTKENSKLVELIETEDALIKVRIEKIKQVALEWAKSLRNSSVQAYLELDEWIGSRYRVEVEVARDMMNIIKETIESEQKLNNLVAIDGDKLTVDFGTLVVPPKEDPPPEPPTEKPAVDQFTVLQLRNLGKQLQSLNPSGFIQTKQMIEFLVKTAALYASLEPLPEGYLQADLSQMQQVVHILDPFETGYVYWRKFLILNARLLPVELEAILEMKNQFSAFASFPYLAKDEFLATKLWFEPPVGTAKRGFDRPGKLKEALFDIFCTEKENNLVFDAIDFMLCCCLDDLPILSLEKAFMVLTESDTCTLAQVHSLFQRFLYVVPVTHRMDTQSKEWVNPYPLSRLEHAWNGLDTKVTWEQLCQALHAECMEWLTCPLYQLEDLSLGGGSRPSSGKQSGQ